MGFLEYGRLFARNSFHAPPQPPRELDYNENTEVLRNFPSSSLRRSQKGARCDLTVSRRKRLRCPFKQKPGRRLCWPGRKSMAEAGRSNRGEWLDSGEAAASASVSGAALGVSWVAQVRVWEGPGGPERAPSPSAGRAGGVPSFSSSTPCRSPLGGSSTASLPSEVMELEGQAGTPWLSSF